MKSKIPLSLRAAVLERLEAGVVHQRGVHVGGQEDHVLHVLAQVLKQPLTLGLVALPAVVGEDVVLLDRQLVHDHLEAGRRAVDRTGEAPELGVAEEVAVGVADRVQALLGHGLRQPAGRNRRSEDHAQPRGRGRRHVGLPGLRVVAHAVRVGLGVAERALVEEEQLEVAPPAHGAVDAPGAAVAHRRVVGEGLHAAAVELRAAHVLGDAGDDVLEGVLAGREVVDELVVVPVRVEARRAAHRAQLAIAEVELVLGPLLGHREGHRERVVVRRLDLGVRVHGVAEVDVEVVALGAHAAEDPAGVPERPALAHLGQEVGVAGPGELDRGVGPGPRGRCGTRPTSLRRPRRPVKR